MKFVFAKNAPKKKLYASIVVKFMKERRNANVTKLAKNAKKVLILAIKNYIALIV
jgi:hypothetical protein